MKKVLFILLALAMVAGGAFAQEVSANGQVQSTFGVHMDLGDDTDDSSFNTWNFHLNDAKVGVSVDADIVTAGVTLQANGGGAGLDYADASVNLDPVTLSVGYAYLPWVQWSSLAYDSNSNWGFGASAVKDVYVQAKFAATDELGIYLGLAQANVHNGFMKDRAVFPGFYVGGDFGADAFSVGAAFLGAPRGKWWGISAADEAAWVGDDPESRFSWMGDLHLKLNFDPLNVGVNVALYGDPGAYGDSGAAGGNLGFLAIGDFNDSADDMILEAMLDIGVGLEPCNIGFTVGLLSNMAETKKGGGFSSLKIGLSADFDLGGGFTLTPGLIFFKPFGKYYDAGADKEFDLTYKGFMDIGLTFSYSF